MATKRGGRTSLASLTGAVGDKSSVDGLVEGLFLAKLPLDQLASNPRNPRYSLGDLAEMASIKVGQLTPATVISRSAWLKLWPEDVDQIGDASYVVAAGNRRLAAARHFEVPGLDVIVSDQFAVDRATIMWLAITENVDRQNLDMLDEAEAIEVLVQELGSATKAAERLKKSQPWISQRRSLLNLPDEVKERVRAGEIAFREARELAQLPPAAALEQWRRSLAAANSDDDQTGGEEPKPPARPKPTTQKAAARTLRRLSASPKILAEAIVEVLTADELRELLAEVEANASE